MCDCQHHTEWEEIKKNLLSKIRNNTEIFIHVTDSQHNNWKLNGSNKAKERNKGAIKRKDEVQLLPSENDMILKLEDSRDSANGSLNLVNKPTKAEGYKTNTQ